MTLIRGCVSWGPWSLKLKLCKKEGTESRENVIIKPIF